jgi:hypothetical protein
MQRLGLLVGENNSEHPSQFFVETSRGTQETARSSHLQAYIALLS